VFVGETRYQAAFILQLVHVKVAYYHPLCLVGIRDLLAEITQLHVGCNIGGLFVNALAYADDIVLLAPSWSALQHLLSALQQHVSNIDMMCGQCGTKKYVCMIFEPRDRTKIMNVSFPQFTIEGCSLQFVKMFKYLGI